MDMASCRAFYAIQYREHDASMLGQREVVFVHAGGGVRVMTFGSLGKSVQTPIGIEGPGIIN